MKKIIAVLVASAVLFGVSARQTFSADDDASADEASPDAAAGDDVANSAAAPVDGQEPQEEETVEEQLPYEWIDERPPASTEEYVPPEIAGTITCSGRGSTIKVDIKGNLMIGLTSLLPLKMMRRISLAREGRACWGSSLWSVCAVTQPICTKVKKHELVCQHPTDVHAVFRNAPRTRFVPQIGGYGSFDLKRWQIVGCVREGCDGVCRQGEKCRPGPSCTINSN